MKDRTVLTLPGFAMIAGLALARDLPRKKRRRGRVLSDVPFGPPSPFESRQQRRYRLRMEAKKARQMKQVKIND